MPDPRQHASQCALFGGMELEDAGRKEKRSSQLGPARRSDDSSDKAPRCEMSCTAEKGGEMGVDVGVSSCRLLMVVHSFPRLSLSLLSDRLGSIDSLLTHAHTTAARHTPGKIAVLGLGLRDRDPRLSCQGRRSSGQQIHAQAVCPTKAVGAATGNPTWPGPGAQQIVA